MSNMPAAPATPLAWVIGASSGIGLDVARVLSAGGARVAISARSRGKLQEAASRDAGLHPFALDVTQTRDVGAVLDAIERDLGPVDTAVLCAAVWHFTDFTDLDIETATQAFDVNVLGAYRVLIALVARMKAHGKGRIVIVASVAGYRGLPKSSAYGPTKAALINLAETLRAELEPHGIIVKLVNPGFVDTPMTRDNPFPMPGLVSSAFAARRIVAGMNGRAFEIVFPFWFALAMRIVRILPNALHFWLLRTFVIADRG